MVGKAKNDHRPLGGESTRTTWSIDNDVLLLIRQRAAVSGESMGKTVSEMFRQAAGASDEEPRFYNGIRLLPKRGNREPVTPELINELLDGLEVRGVHHGHH